MHETNPVAGALHECAACAGLPEPARRRHGEIERIAAHIKQHGGKETRDANGWPAYLPPTRGKVTPLPPAPATDDEAPASAEVR